MPQTQPTQLDPDAVNLAKAIRQTESGGNFQAKGKSGEYGGYQFTLPTWQKTASKYGVNVPLNQATPEQQNEVAYKQIKEWKDQGNNVGQIASMWNAGEGKPNAYLEGNAGVNKYGAKYDTAAYAKSVATAYQTIKKGGQVGADPNNPSSTANPTPLQPQQPQDESPSLGGFAGNLASSAGNFLGGIGNAIMHPIKTAENLGGLAIGAVEAGGGALLGQAGKIDTPQTQQLGQVADFYKKRYGGLSNIAHTLYTDPVGAAADASMLLGGGAGIAGKVGELSDVANATRLAETGGTLSDISAVQGASTASKVASGLKTASEVTNPLTLPGKAVEGLATGLKKSAQGSYMDVLAPTTKADKFLSQGVVSGRDVQLPSGENVHVPGLVERGVLADSRETLAGKVTQGLEDTGAKYKETEANIPANAQIEVKPILDQIEQAKQQFIIKGNNGPVIADSQAVQNLSDFQKTVQDLSANGMVSKESLTQLKQLWQEKVAKAGGYYGKTLAEGSKMDALSEAEHAIRRQLDTQFPDIAKINAEYKFWKDAQKVINDTIERKRGQSGIVRKGLSAGIGAIAGSPFGIAGSGGGAYLAKIAMDAFQSPAWKTVSAVTKDRIANALVGGKVALAGKLLRDVVTPVSRMNRAGN